MHKCINCFHAKMTISNMQFIYLRNRQSFFHRFPQIKTAKFSIKELKKIVKFRSSHLCSPIVKYFERFPTLLHKREEDEIMSFGSIQSNNFCLHSGLGKMCILDYLDFLGAFLVMLLNLSRTKLNKLGVEKMSRRQ